ncbi:MAG: hypothetical protein H6721_05320 [Sandaracinus sp.]|nr:hypothetical protein [Sandaracinus sp.]MCB9613863.1 hypothetical protein [Sandaracinus sp.]MCB9631546.1 hypothetical protein [Sandaracinus sp.]
MPNSLPLPRPRSLSFDESRRALVALPRTVGRRLADRLSRFVFDIDALDLELVRDDLPEVSS